MQKKVINEKLPSKNSSTQTEQKSQKTSTLPNKTSAFQPNIKNGPSKIQSQSIPSSISYNQKGQEKKIEENQDSQIPRVETVKISIQKSNQLQIQQKFIEGIPKIKAQKVKLILNTNFERDGDLLAFSMVIIKVASQVNYLVWKVKGMFTDEGQAKTVGDIISRFSHAYSIHLHLDDTFFADKGANSLANGLKKLQNLRTLFIQLNFQIGKVAKKLTQAGLNKINEAISSLKNLQIVEFCYLNWDSFIMPKNLSNINFIAVVSINQENNKSYSQQIFEKFQSDIEPNKHKLVSLHVQNFYNEEAFEKAGYCYYHGEGGFLYKDYIELYPQILRYCFNLPYLTQYSNNFIFNEGDFDQDLFYLFQLRQSETLLKNFMREKQNILCKIVAFNINIHGFLSINPAMILTDLYIN